EVDQRQNYVLALLEADGKSWPTWCRNHTEAGERVRRITQQIVEMIPGSSTRVALMAHSGGGAFITHFINAPDELPANVERIAYPAERALKIIAGPHERRWTGHVCDGRRWPGEFHRSCESAKPDPAHAAGGMERPAAGDDAGERPATGLGQVERRPRLRTVDS